MKRVLGVLIFVLLSLGVMNSQTVSELQARKKKALENLELTSSLIEKTSKSKTKTLTQLNLLNCWLVLGFQGLSFYVLEAQTQSENSSRPTTIERII